MARGLIAWDFLDRSFPWSESDANPLLASSQIGIKPSGAGFLNGAGGGGNHTFENQKGGGLIHSLGAAGPVAARTGNLRAPGDLARVFASESIWTGSPRPGAWIPCNSGCVTSPAINGSTESSCRRKNPAGPTGRRAHSFPGTDGRREEA